MKKRDVYVIGLMSGTSLDGLDIVYCRFNKDEYSDFEILFSQTYEYSSEWKKNLKDVITFSKKDIDQLDVDFGSLLGKKTNEFIKENKIKQIDFIASHGHTVFHQPEKGYTLQIGDGQKIANTINQKVVCDFRTQDVDLGGQGAPLVPIGDELLFGEYDYCLNLGGFANVSYKREGKRIAFDICPVNIVLNEYARRLGFEYDDKGKLAYSGEYLLQKGDELNSLEFYKKLPPKSLGLEWVKKEIFPRLDSHRRNPRNVLKTFTLHAARAIAKVFPRGAKVLITGGGAYNDYLISKILYYKKIEIIIPEKKLVEFKEALIFAFLGVLRVDNQVNCLSSVTGAKKDHSSGKIYYPNN